ncbi:LexA family protein [Desulfofundulus thermocisternus]|uniref:LexA family protein n=1 Tax=Desulfofundulus thermocisternus TaxID=42471 RepID=UPI00217E64B4|nr:S24 family peptidase [Desulfofundulus thermocisternus]MCS5697254.1 hypothetical protein [Desulfofundulus thermocisternus]
MSRLADIYHVTTDFLLGHNPGHLVRTISILGQIRASLSILTEENYEGGIEIPSDIIADFALRVRGNSMIGAGILDGDYGNKGTDRLTGGNCKKVKRLKTS